MIPVNEEIVARKGFLDVAGRCSRGAARFAGGDLAISSFAIVV
jgi:hypothetical protein